MKATHILMRFLRFPHSGGRLPTMSLTRIVRYLSFWSRLHSFGSPPEIRSLVIVLQWQ